MDKNYLYFTGRAGGDTASPVVTILRISTKGRDDTAFLLFSYFHYPRFSY